MRSHTLWHKGGQTVFGAVGEAQAGHARLIVDHRDILQEHIVADAAAERLGAGLFCRPALGVARRPAAFIARGLISPKVYGSVGLEPKAARKAALANPHYHETTRWMGEKIIPFLEEVGMTNRTARAIYRHAGLMA